MNTEEYKKKMTDIVMRYGKMDRGAKYVRKWDRFWDEKTDVANLSLAGRSDLKSVLDIGTGVGMLPFIYQQRGLEVEGTDITEDITGPIFKQCCDLINMKRYELWIKPKTPMNLTRNYDLIVATRTEFDRQEGWDWEYFLDDCFKHSKRVFFKLNEGGSIKHHNDRIRNLLFNTRADGSAIGNWCILLDKEQWQNS